MRSARHAIIPLIFIPLGFFIYANVLRGPFILDDAMYIAENYRIRDMADFLKDFSGTRYIGLLTFAINYYFGGLNTFGYHLVNTIIHIINAILVYFLVGSIEFGVGSKNSMNSKIPNPQLPTLNYLPIAVSLIFLVHPIQTQVVSYISQRFTSLATLFYLLVLLLYAKARLIQIKNGEGRRTQFFAFYILSLLSAVLAMKTKEISFTLPFLVLLYEITFFSNDVSRIRSRLLYLLPFFLTLLIIPLTFLSIQNIGDTTPAQDVGERIMKWQLVEMKDLSRYTYLLTQFRVIITYIRLLILPINQTLFYDYPFSQSLFKPATFISGLFILSALVFTIYLYVQSLKKANGVKKIISFGILWFFITLSIESSIIPIKDVIFEHRLYLPSMGFILSATVSLFYGFWYFEKRFNRPLWNYLLVIIIVAAVILSFFTYRRNILWRDSYLMWLDNVNKAPNRFEPHYNLGVIYSNQDRFDEAIKEYTTALKLKPSYAYAHNNLGIAYSKQSLIDEGIREFLIAIRLKPDYADAHNNLGNAYFKQGRTDEAIKEYLAAIILETHYTNAHYNLGHTYRIKGLKHEARKEFEMVLKLNPYDADARQAIEWLEK